MSNIEKGEKVEENFDWKTSGKEFIELQLEKFWLQLKNPENEKDISAKQKMSFNDRIKERLSGHSRESSF